MVVYKSVTEVLYHSSIVLVFVGMEKRHETVVQVGNAKPNQD